MGQKIPLEGVSTQGSLRKNMKNKMQLKLLEIAVLESSSLNNLRFKYPVKMPISRLIIA